MSKTDLEVIKGRIPKEYRKHINDVENWRFYEKQSVNEIDQKLRNKNVNREAIDDLIQYAQIFYVEQLRKRALRKCLWGGLLILGGLLVLAGIFAPSVGSRMPMPRIVLYFSIAAISGGIVMIIQGIYLNLRLKNMQDQSKIAQISKLLNE